MLYNNYESIEMVKVLTTVYHRIHVLITTFGLGNLGKVSTLLQPMVKQSNSIFSVTT